MENQRVVIREFGGPEVLELVQDEIQLTLHPDEALLQIEATSACFTDLMIRKGLYQDVKQKPPFSPGYDLVGRVKKVGSKVVGFCVGDRVAALTITGAYSQHIILPAQELVKVPQEVDAGEAVSLVLSYVTAYQMLHRVAKVKAGDKILIHGAGGAVGTALAQLGRLSGLEMYGTGSESKVELIAEQGVTPINYQHVDFEKEISQLCDEGLNAVFDPIGGRHFNKSFRTLAPGGTLVAFGFYNAVMGRGSIPVDYMRVIALNLMPNGRSASFYSIGSMKEKHPGWFQQDLKALFDLLKEGKIKPVIANRLPLQAAAEAHRMIENRQVAGRLVLQVA